MYLLFSFSIFLFWFSNSSAMHSNMSPWKRLFVFLIFLSHLLFLSYTQQKQIRTFLVAYIRGFSLKWLIWKRMFWILRFRCLFMAYDRSRRRWFACSFPKPERDWMFLWTIDSNCARISLFMLAYVRFVVISVNYIWSLPSIESYNYTFDTSFIWGL